MNYYSKIIVPIHLFKNFLINTPDHHLLTRKTTIYDLPNMTTYSVSRDS